MNIAEALINLVAPHMCLCCGVESATICPKCEVGLELKLQSTISPFSLLDHVTSCAVYDGIAKELIHQLKFERAKAVHEYISDRMAEIFQPHPDTVVVPITTAPARMRQRGYDQSVLIARRYARTSGLSYCNALLRSGTLRQVGAHRDVRLRQMQAAFAVQKTAKISGKHIILIDDVVTTGATLEAAAAELLRAGAKSVAALVFARA